MPASMTRRFAAVSRSALPRTPRLPTVSRRRFRIWSSGFLGRRASARPSKACARNSFRAAPLPDQRRQVTALDAVALDSWVGGRPGLIYRCRVEDDEVKLHCHSTEIRFPRRAAAALTYALEAPRFRVRDMSGGLDDAGKLTLVRRLIREGLVAMLPSGGDRE